MENIEEKSRDVEDSEKYIYSKFQKEMRKKLGYKPVFEETMTENFPAFMKTPTFPFRKSNKSQ